MSEDRIWILLSRRDNGDITPEELKELEELLRSHEQVNAANAFVREVLEKHISVMEQPIDAEAGWQSINARIQAQKESGGKSKVIAFRRWLAAAGIAAAIAGSALWYMTTHQGNGHKMQAGHVNQVSTQPGSRSKIVLPDGTRVWLNAGSNLSYADFNSAATREVTLTGEAFFEVVHDAAHPFVVHTNDMDIRDIGTSFEIKSYPGDRNFEATLIEGAIEIINPKEPERKILLKPKEKIIIPLKDSLQEIKRTGTTDADESTLYTIAKIKPMPSGVFPETSWVQNQLAFDNEPFEELALKMERWYNVKIYFTDTGIAHTRFSGIIKNETIDQAFQAMQFSVPFSYLMKNNEVWIGKK